ncbi:MAG: XTP/dITP diphosphatase [Candidatus Freyarchaeota archaeon]|nr:XTP/dITP diphosphatase [Candidatus Freyrarchaeum guaymaensis]HDO80943.1 XTP/dITP diphosphatase [Candidatus Bathyarchaeota archaeon]
MRKVFFATGNPHKLKEAKRVLSKYGITVEQLTVKRVEVQSESLEEIARFSLEHVMREVHLDGVVLVEDAGLFIEALNGFPGPYSSYVFSKIGNEGILKLMDGVENRRAKFESVVAAVNQSRIVTFRGEVLGVIAHEAKGGKGFGFDPIFIPYEGDGRTFGELEVEEKNALSHRARALRKLAEWLTGSSKII